MIEEYLSLADRIRQELDNLLRVVKRADHAMDAARRQTEDQDLFVDSAALNLHDFYAGLERIFHQIATTVDGHIPAGTGWHRNLLNQMQVEVTDLRPPVLSEEAVQTLDEFLRFRHVVRNVYAFRFDPERVKRLVDIMQPTLEQIQTERMEFVSFLEQVGRDG